MIKAGRRFSANAALMVVLSSLGLALGSSVPARAVAWPAAADISIASQNSAAPQVTVGRDGTAIAVWEGYNGYSIIQSATRAPGGSWQIPVGLSASGQDAYNPQVAIGPDGVATAVWQRYNGTTNVIQSATRGPTGAWQSPVDVSLGSVNAFNPEVAVGPDGTTTAVWRRWTGTGDVVQSATRPPAGSWQTPLDLSNAVNQADDPDVVFSPDGTTTAVWERFNGTNYVIQSATRIPGATWQAPVDLSTASNDAEVPQVAVGPDGTTTAVWWRSNGTNSVIQSATRAPGATWQTPVDLSNAGGDAGAPQVAVGPDGTTTAVWWRSNGTNSIIQSATRAPGATWQAPVDLSAPGQNAYDPKLAVAPNRATAAIWDRFNGTNSIVQTAVRLPEGAWQAPADLSTAGQNAGDEGVAIGADGTAAAVWARVNGTIGTIQAITVDRVFAHLSPASASVPSTGPIRGPKAITRPHTAKYSFTGTTGSTFQCRLDKGRVWKTCRSPYRLKTRHLKAGKHILKVRAVLDGIADPTPSTKKFKVRA